MFAKTTGNKELMTESINEESRPQSKFTWLIHNFVTKEPTLFLNM
jgi:hypothetical protein